MLRGYDFVLGKEENNTTPQYTQYHCAAPILCLPCGVDFIRDRGDSFMRLIRVKLVEELMTCAKRLPRIFSD